MSGWLFLVSHVVGQPDNCYRHVMVCFCQIWSTLALVLMPRGRKRKGPSSTGPSAVPIHASAPTLKEHIWSELRSVIYKHSTVPLINKEAGGQSMTKFR